MALQLQHTIPDTLKIQMITQCLQQAPQNQVQTLINEQFLVQPKTFFNGKKFLRRATANVLIAENCNTIILYSSHPINIQIGESGSLLEESNIFVHSGKPINVYVSNMSPSLDADIKFITANNETLPLLDRAIENRSFQPQNPYSYT